MKTLFLTCLLLLSIASFGKIWIVDNNVGSTAKDFTSLMEAHDGASAGDTLYLIGSPNNYKSGNNDVTNVITKRLVIIGPGYFLSENPNTQVSPASSYLTTVLFCNEEIEFAPGSEGSVMMGLIIRRIKITTNNIIIKRNLFVDGACPSEKITISGSNIFIVQNYIGGTGNGTGIKVNAGFSNIVINNNFILNYCYGCGGGIVSLNSANSSLEVSNNIFTGGINVSNSIVQNNIFLTNNIFSASTSIVRNNLHVFNSLPAGNGNTNGVSTTSMFEGPGSTDGQWKLKIGSLAIGVGFNGVDCGMFGGPEPYVLSGIPPIPTIYSLTAPAVGEKNTGLPIQIKVKSNN